MSVRYFACVFLPLTAIACSDSSGSSGVTTGLPPDKKLSALTDADMQAACNSILSTRPFSDAETHTINCNLAGTSAATSKESDAEVQAACKTAYDACNAKPVTPPTNNCANQKVPSGFKDCDALVSEYDACLTQQVEFLKVYENANYCATLKVGKQPTLTSTGACGALQTKCPKVFNG